MSLCRLPIYNAAVRVQYCKHIYKRLTHNWEYMTLTLEAHIIFAHLQDYRFSDCSSETWASLFAWLNASQRSRDGVGMNRSARGWSVKQCEQSQGLDTALYKNIPFFKAAVCGASYEVLLCGCIIDVLLCGCIIDVLQQVADVL